MSVTNYINATVYAPDGTQVYPNLKDANGNFFSKDANGNIIDTLGRMPVTVTSSCNNNSDQTCYNVLNPQGGRSIYTLTTATISVSTAFGQSGVTEYPGPLTVVQTIALPDGTSYQFGYDSYGELNSITLQTGGQITYGYTNYQDSFGNKNRWVTSRTSGGGTWNYNPQVLTTCSSGSVNCQQQVTVTKPSGDTAVHTFTLNNGAWGSNVQVYTGAVSSSSLLATRTITWNMSNACQTSGCTGNQFIQKMQDTMTWAGGPSPSQTKQYTYDSQYDSNLVSLKEWKFYTGSLPASPDRETDLTYLNTPAYTAKNILNRIVTSTIKDTSGTIRFRRDIAYDQYSSFSASNCITGVTQHDDTNYGCSAITRGNSTSVTEYTDPLTPSGGLTGSLTYDSLGNLRSTGDTLGHTTTLAYSDSWSSTSCPPPSATYAYLTSSTNALNQSSSTIYEPCTGMVASVKDPNNQTISFSYDSAARLIQQTLPDGGQTSWAYNDTANPPNVAITQKLNSTQNVTGAIVFDNLGRVSQTQLTSDPTGTDYTDTTYDTLGRVWKRSNPHRSTSSSTDGTTTFAYDGLDRVIQVTRPDGATVLTTYSGGATQLSDEGKGTQRVQRIYQNDGLGRLASVCEVYNGTALIGTTGTPAACGQDIGATGFLTAYPYDILNNLTQVTQGGLNARAFTYDSLSRPAQASDPESGTTNFYYTTSAGSLCSGDTTAVCRRTDARTITTTYAYDALNRLKSRSYSDGTPTANYNYDETAPWGWTVANPIGRLTTYYTKNSTGTTLTASLLDYTAMGRVKDFEECVPQNCSSAPSLTVNYGYSLLGVMNYLHASQSGGFDFALNYGFTTAGWLSTITSTLSDSNHPGTLLSGPAYAPPGLLTSAQLGNAVTETAAYNSRFWPTSLTAGSLYTATLTSYAPNGDILASNDSVNGNWTYAYDAFNRLTCANLTNGSCTAPTNGTPTYTYDYDRFGNRWHQNGPHSMQLSFSGNNNRMDGYSYDAAGNLLTDGTHSYTYDAENRLIQVDGGSTATYTYDAGGNRVSKTAGGVSVDHLYDILGDRVVAEVTPSGSWNRGEVYVGGRHLATYANGTTYFVHPDWLGTERVHSNVGGATYQTCTSLTFGDWQSCSASDAGPTHFAGYERDAEVGLDKTWARKYSSQFGHWTTPDPLGGDISNPQSLNHYPYVGNDPTNAVDPPGMLIIPGEGAVPWGPGGFDFWNEFDLLEFQIGTANLYHSNSPYFRFEDFASQELADFAQQGEIQLLFSTPIYESILLDTSGSGGDGKAPLNNRNQKRFEKARQKALVGLDNPDCQKFLRDHGIDPAWVRDAICAQIPYDGTKSTITLYDANAYAPYSTPPAFYHSMSMARYFDKNPNTFGMAEPLGTSAYYRPGGIFGSGGIKPGNIFHEALHNALGLGDDDLAEKLGVHGGGSADINPALASHHCI